MAIKQNNKTQSDIRFNLSNILGLSEEQEKMIAQNQGRLRGGIAQTYFNGRNAGTESGGTEPTCTPCGGGGGGGSGGGGGVQPSGNCEKKNISELRQIIEDYAAASFCDKELPDVQFSTIFAYDKPANDNSRKEIELRMLCPSDDCEERHYCDISFNARRSCVGVKTENTLEQNCVLMSVDEVLSIANDFRMQVISNYEASCFGSESINEKLLTPFDRTNCRITIYDDGNMSIVFPIGTISSIAICTPECPSCYDENLKWCYSVGGWFTCSAPHSLCV